MPFTSQLFPTILHFLGENSGTNGILMVRPLLEFGKDDMYKICLGANQPYVEDPTNQSKLFARNRIRMLLRSMPSRVFKSEIQMLISACRLTRSFVESACFKMIKETVAVMDNGYAIIDVEKLEPSNVDNLCLSKFLSMVLQFISQRHRPIRGGTMQLLLDYIRAVPCKTSLTVAGCYISPAPRSKGLKVLVSCSVNSPQSSRMRLSYTYPLLEQQPAFVKEVDEIIMVAKSCSDQSISNDSGLPFLHSKSSKAFLAEAEKLDLISESTLARILSLQTEEAKNFNLKADVDTDNLNYKMKSGNATNIEIYPGLSCHFMSRFFVTWKLFKDVNKDKIASSLSGSHLSRKGDDSHRCSLCTINVERGLVIRHMVDSDWLYLAQVSESNEVKEHQHHVNNSICKLKQNEPAEDQCTPYMQLSAQKALRALKSIPVSARKALPVLVDSHDLPVSIPSIGFKCCPFLLVDVVFKPRIPLGGGYASYI